MRPPENKPAPFGGRFVFSQLLSVLEAPAGHAGVEHGCGAVDHVRHLGVRRIEEQEEYRGQMQEVRGVGQDRKSTRLNSSHT